MREFDVEAANGLDGLWVTRVEGFLEPPTPLTLDFVLDDGVLLGALLSARGASLPRASRRLANVGGHVYEALVPLSRAAREVAPLDAELSALVFATEAHGAVERHLPEFDAISKRGLARLAARGQKQLRALALRVLVQEQSGAQHYRWLAEMDLGILPDDALETTLAECVAVERQTRSLELEVTLELVTLEAALGALAAHVAADALGLALGALIAPDALDLASATPAVALASLAIAHERGTGSRRTDPSADFCASFGERGPDERELAAPRWREQNGTLERLLELTLGSRPSESQARLAEARHERLRETERLAKALGRSRGELLRTLGSVAKGLARLRSRLHLVRARSLCMLRTAALDIDRRLERLLGSEPGTAFFLELGELRNITTRPNPDLSRRADERRRAWAQRARLPAPPVLLGRGRAPDDAATLSGVGAGGGEVTGPVVVAQRFSDALALAPGGVLVVRSLSAGWAPLLPSAGAVVTEAGGLCDEGVLVALSLGAPLVVGVRGATSALRSGDSVRVHPPSGKVEKV